MRRWSYAALAGLCLSAGLAGGALGAEEKKVDLKVGDPAPQFEATDDEGKTWKSSEHVGKDFLIVYFFPAAMTGG